VLAVLSTASSLNDEALTTELRLFVLISLWGNRMDLSLWPTGSIGNVVDAFAEVYVWWLKVCFFVSLAVYTFDCTKAT